jgi:hypothetical protein
MAKPLVPVATNLSFIVGLFAVAACESDPGPESLVIVESELALGQVVCGSTRSGTLTVMNPGAAATIVGVAPTLPDVTVAPNVAVIQPGEDQIFNITSRAPRIGTPGFVSRGDLRVMTGKTELRVPLQYETAGVSVTLRGQRTVDFGELRPSFSSADGAFIETTAVGVDPAAVVTVGAPSSPAFEVMSVTGTYVALRLTGGSVPQRHEATLPITVTGEALCTPQDLSVDLVGVVSNEPVRGDNIAFDLGDVDPCGPAGASLNLTSGVPSPGFVATLHHPAGWLAWSGPSSGDVGMTTLTLLAPYGPDRPAGPVSGTVTFAFTGGGSKTIPIRGTVLDRTATPASDLELGNVPAGTTVLRQVSIRNTGTSVASMETFGFGVTVTPRATQIDPGGTRDLWVSFEAGHAGTAIASHVEIDLGCRSREVINLRGRVVD